MNDGRSIDAPPRSWRYAPPARGGLLVAISGIAALVVVAQLAVDRAIPGESSPGLTTAAAVVGFLVVAYMSRLVPPGGHYLRHDVGHRFGSAVYLSALAAALVTVLVRDVLLTGVCVGGLALLAVFVMTHRMPTRDGTP